jgi:hypothetical protein
VQAICDFSFIATSFLEANTQIHTMTGDGKMADKHPKGTHNPSQSSTQRWDNEGGAIKGVHAKRPRNPNQLGKAIVDLATMDEADRAKLHKKIPPKTARKKPARRRQS